MKNLNKKDETFKEKIKTRVQKFRENPISRKYENKKSKDAMTKKRLPQDISGEREKS